MYSFLCGISLYVFVVDSMSSADANSPFNFPNQTAWINTCQYQANINIPPFQVLSIYMLK